MNRIVRVSANKAAQAEVQQEYDFPIDNDPESSGYAPRAMGFDDYDYEERHENPNRARVIALGGSVILLVIIFVVIAFLLSIRSAQQGTQRAGGNAVAASTTGLDTGPRAGALAPAFSLVDVHTNQPFTLSSLRGKPVFINFWGTWCPPCRAEMPEMQRLYDKYPGQLQIVGISMGPRDFPEQVKNFVDQYKYPWTFIHDPDYTVATAYQVAAIPSSYFIDKDGVIKAVQVGGMDFARMERNFLLSR